MKYLFTLIVLFCFDSFALCQGIVREDSLVNSKDYIKHSLLNAKQKQKVKRLSFDLKLRQSFESADTKPEPAIISYTNPKNTKESFLVDAAIAPSFYFEKSKVTLSAVGEYHRNNLVDEEQNTQQIGILGEFRTNPNFNVDESSENSHTSIITTNAKYSNNITDAIKSLQLTGEWTMLFTKSSGKFNNLLPNSNNDIGALFFYEYFPSLGFEHENRYKAENDSTEGNLFRGVAKIYIGIRPLHELLKYKLEIFSDFNYRYDLVNTTKYNDLKHPLMEIGINYILIDKGSQFAKVSFSYTKGENPIQGLKDQEFYLVSLKVKI